MYRVYTVSTRYFGRSQTTPRPSEHPPVMGEKMLLFFVLFLTFSAMVANPKKHGTLHGGQSRSWSAEQGKKKKKKKSGSLVDRFVAWVESWWIIAVFTRVWIPWVRNLERETHFTEFWLPQTAWDQCSTIQSVLVWRDFKECWTSIAIKKL